MLVGRVEARAFKRYASVVVNLPACGVTLVTGDNGAGKSSLLDAVAWAGWGRTMRGANPWQAAQGAAPCVVALECAGVEVRRERTGRKVSLTWARPGDAPTEYETTTKAQAALEVVVGSFDMWRRTSVFTAADAWAFADATDAQRKTMLEALLGLDMFDGALERCRADLRAAQQELARDEQALARTRGVLAQAQSSQASLRAAQPAEPPDGAALARDLARLDAALEGATLDSAALAAAARDADAMLQAARREKTAATARVAGVSRPTCDACGQGVPEAHAGAVRDRAAADTKAADEAAHEAAGRLDAVARERAAHDADLQRMRARRDALMRQQAAQEQAQRQRETWARLLRDADAAVANATAEEAVIVERVEAGRVRLEDLRVTESVLGMRGVRAQVLDGALHAVERVANVWLSRFAGEGVEVKLRSRTALKSGGTSDAITVEVIGFGGPEGYAGASTGERRRVDVAIMLALADVMRARAGVEAGTLFFDEVFDALDPAGIDAVCAALREVAAERSVVVITHNDGLAARIGADQHLHANAGSITRR